jgi:hypothetical protein
MPTPAILDADTIDWTYDDLSEELEQLALVEDLEPRHGRSLSELRDAVLDGEIVHVVQDLERVAMLAAR